MSFVIARLDALTMAASHLIGVGSAIAAQSGVVAAPPISLPLAVVDEVLALPAAEFSARALVCEGATDQAMTARGLFTLGLDASADSYAATKAANTIAVS
jgi:hypothetical protein